MPSESNHPNENFELNFLLGDHGTNFQVKGWVELPNGHIFWYDVGNFQAKPLGRMKFLGENVLVGTHNRDKNLFEPINTAKFDLYLESHKTGLIASIMGNTIPADVEKYGTVAEGLYSAEYSKYKGDGALLINGGGELPTAKGNPNNKKNYSSNGQLKSIEEHIISEIFFHKGNYARPSLLTRAGKPISAGCQTGGSGPGSLAIYRKFIKLTEGFRGNFYLRGGWKKG